MRSSRRPAPEVPDRYAHGVWGTRLRHAALAVLIRARGRPLSVAEIWEHVERNHMVRAGVTAKHLADALRHECRRGRARRVAHGHYVVGEIAPRTRRRILFHEKQLPAGDTHAAMMRFIREREADIAAEQAAAQSRSDSFISSSPTSTG
jgi:hypothetical protein